MIPGDIPSAHGANPGGPPPVAGLPLLPGRGLLHDEAACLPLRSRHGQCRACEVACPVDALTVSLREVRLSEACIGCARCTAACPTQALSLAEMAGWSPAPVAPGQAAMPSLPRQPLRVECRKVPQAQRGDAAVTLPCLGALTAGRLLEWVAGGREVQVMDRGWCGGCEANPNKHPLPALADGELPVAVGDEADAGTPHPAVAAVASAVMWLQALQTRTQARTQAPPQTPPPVRIKPERLPLAQRPSAIPPAPEPEPAMARRQFFRAAMERPAGRQRPLPMGGDGRAGFPAAARRPSPERERQHQALTTLAAQQGAAPPSEFYPSLHADARCCDARMCVALCPTAALTSVDDGQAAHLRFDPVRCIACGTCERGCPESALHLSAHGGEATPQLLVSHTRRACPSCGEVFTPAADAAPADGAAPLCPTCTKSQRFMADARHQLFGALR